MRVDMPDDEVRERMRMLPSQPVHEGHREIMATVAGWRDRSVSDADFVAAVRRFKGTAEGRAWFSERRAALSGSGPAGSTTNGGAPVGLVRIDVGAFEELKRQAAAAPALVAAAREAQAHPVVAGAPPRAPVPPVLLSGPSEPSDEDWDDFRFGVGLGGRPKPRPLFEVDTRHPGGVARSASHLSAPSEADIDRFVSDLGVGSNPFGRGDHR